MHYLLLVLLLALSACGSGGRGPATSGAGSGEGGWSCVPYARARTGLALRGDAWQWWEAAAGRLERGSQPRPGSVLVIGRTGRMPQGHVAVVASVVTGREIRVDHANWASGASRGRVARDQPVRDVSPGNDWSLVRVWYPPVAGYGTTTYPSHGFIHPPRR